MWKGSAMPIHTSNLGRELVLPSSLSFLENEGHRAVGTGLMLVVDQGRCGVNTPDSKPIPY